MPKHKDVDEKQRKKRENKKRKMNNEEDKQSWQVDVVNRVTIMNLNDAKKKNENALRKSEDDWKLKKLGAVVEVISSFPLNISNFCIKMFEIVSLCIQRYSNRLYRLKY